jgi:hypothetical protein
MAARVEEVTKFAPYIFAVDENAGIGPAPFRLFAHSPLFDVLPTSVV